MRRCGGTPAIPDGNRGTPQMPAQLDLDEEVIVPDPPRPALVPPLLQTATHLRSLLKQGGHQPVSNFR